MIDATALPRLLHGPSGRPLTLEQHEALFVSQAPAQSIAAELQASGLTGRGGAAFPTWRKAEFIAGQRGHNKFMVVNAMEGEPGSHKDRTLLSANPHLVLDGAEILASLIGAKHIAICVARDNPTVVNHLKRAVHERERRSLRGPKLELHTPPWRYVAGEESALVHWLDDNESLPQYRAHRPHVLRISHNPAMVDNTETCANVGLIARFGADWFRKLGTAESPGTALVSLTGAVANQAVVEVPLGTPISTILARANADPRPQALLLGGYGGSWISGQHVDTPYANEFLRPLGATVGAGIMVVLPRSACGLVETQRIVQWMANESARQCGPCAFGLPSLAEDLTHLVRTTRDAEAVLRRLHERCGLIEGRGACHHPDGVVQLVRSALKVFADDLRQHMSGAPCAPSRSNQHVVKVPTLEHEEEQMWE
jgi:hypothetical protein